MNVDPESILDFVDDEFVSRVSQERNVSREQVTELLVDVQHTLMSVSDHVLFLAYETVEETPEAYYLLVEEEIWERILEVSEVQDNNVQTATRTVHNLTLDSMDPGLQSVDYLDGLVFRKDRYHKLLDAGLSDLEAKTQLSREQGLTREDIANRLNVAESIVADMEDQIKEKREQYEHVSEILE